MMLRRLLAALLVVFACAAPVQAREVIDRFISNVIVNADGTLNVLEEITVLAEGVEIRRGILRDFPTEYQAQDGSKVSVGFTVNAVRLNGVDVPWTQQHITNGQRLRIGDPNRLLQPGYHTFSIAYQTSRQLGFFKDYDELYWNVTGNGWTFPINEAFVTVELPSGASIGNARAFTGFAGSTAESANIKKTADNKLQASTRTPLERGQGMTIAIAWQKGIVQPPTQAQSWQWWLQDNLGPGILAATLASVFAYFAFAWARVGRDPPKGNIFPLLKPPGDLGPAAMRYIWKHGFDYQAFSAALVGLAVKGHLNISGDASNYTIARLASGTAAVSESETALLNALPHEPLLLSNKNYSIVAAARSALESKLVEDYSRSMFRRNIGWFAAGAGLSVSGLLLSGYFMTGAAGSALIFVGIFAAIWWGVVLTAGYGAVSGSWSAGGLLGMLGRMFRLLFLVPFALAGIWVPLNMIAQFGSSTSGLVFLAMAAILGLVNFVFAILLPAPTVAGRQMLDQIEGFRMYLATAEEKRLDALNPPEKTPALFERYLPYAMALDCENEWNTKFTSVLAAAAAAGATAPVWYGGTGSNWYSGGFARSLNQSLSSSVSSATTPPGSRSGTGGFSGGGGGFSGGGGGGGGGSGW